MTARATTGPSRPVGKRAAGGAPRVPFALLVCGLIVGGLALLVALNTASAANELRRSSLTDRDAQVVAAIEELRNEVAASAAPANLAAAAHRLGMVPAGNPAFIVLGADGSAKVLGKPATVTGPPVPAPAPPPAPHRSTTPDKPRSTATSTATSTAPATSTSTATAAAAKSTKTGRATKTDGAAPSPSPSPATSARPTPTPTPTMTLPGGAR